MKYMKLRTSFLLIAFLLWSAGSIHASMKISSICNGQNSATYRSKENEIFVEPIVFEQQGDEAILKKLSEMEKYQCLQREYKMNHATCKYGCTRCQAAFKKEWNVCSHVARMHTGCYNCLVSFKLKDVLAYHMITKHPTRMSIANVIVDGIDDEDTKKALQNLINKISQNTDK